MSTPREEALKKNSRVTWLSLIIGVLSIVVSFVLLNFDIQIEFAGVLLLGGFIEIIIFFVCLGRRTRLKRIHCDLCGKKYDYEKEVAWEVLSYVTKTGTNGNAKKEANVKVDCICGNCGTSKTFGRVVTVASINGQTGELREVESADPELKFYFR